MTTKSPQKTRPITRAEQTLKTLRLIRATKNAPYSRWEILLTMAICGEDTPVTTEDLYATCGTGAMMETLRRMTAQEHLSVTKKESRNFYTMTAAGKQELARVLKGAEK